MLLHKGVIKHSVHEEGEFISSMFLRPKKDGSYRMILNGFYMDYCANDDTRMLYGIH